MPSLNPDDRIALAITLEGIAELVRDEKTRWKPGEHAAFKLLSRRYLNYHIKKCWYCRWATCSYADQVRKLSD